MTPHTLCSLAVAAALVAAAIGHRYSPTRRARRRIKRQQAAIRNLRIQQLASAHRLVTGQLARNPGGWERFWDAHDLDGCLRGGDGDA